MDNLEDVEFPLARSERTHIDDAAERPNTHALLAKPSDELTPDALLDELSEALDAAGQALVIISRRTRRIHWCSSHSAHMHSALTVGQPIASTEGLVGIVNAIEASELSGPAMANVSPALKTSRPANSQQNRVGTVGQTPSESEVSVMRISQSHITLRLQMGTRPDDYLQRYVADREKLFMLSRSVSVSEMATTLAHELNQPIGTIANLLQGLKLLLNREYEGQVPESLDTALTRASDQTRFAAGIITRIRNFTEARTPRLAECEASELLTGTVELLDWVFDSKQVHVRITSEDSPLTISGDRILLQQVFANLLRNSVDALQTCPVGSRQINVDIARESDGVVIKISDNGAGLLGISRETPFEAFRSGKSDGMGIGLNICRSFVEMHRGKLWLTAPETGGCTAHVLLPERIS